MASKRSKMQDEAPRTEEQMSGDAPDGRDIPDPVEEIDLEPAGRDEELEQLRAEAEEWKDRCLRAIADMENFRRRARVDAEDAGRRVSERLVADLLPIADNLGRALEAAAQAQDFDALHSGVELIHRQFRDVLAAAGLKRIQAVGRPFDPNLHEAIMQVEPAEGQQPHEVVEELRAGYTLNDRVLRPSLVKVTSG
jgi:molecular chaperone GrpE